MGDITYFHVVRETLEEEALYMLTLQESGIITDETYFGSKDHDDCSISVGNECNRFIAPPYQIVGFGKGYDI